MLGTLDDLMHSETSYHAYTKDLATDSDSATSHLWFSVQECVIVAKCTNRAHTVDSTIFGHSSPGLIPGRTATIAATSIILNPTRDF